MDLTVYTCYCTSDCGWSTGDMDLTVYTCYCTSDCGWSTGDMDLTVYTCYCTSDCGWSTGDMDLTVYMCYCSVCEWARCQPFSSLLPLAAAGSSNRRRSCVRCGPSWLEKQKRREMGKPCGELSTASVWVSLCLIVYSCLFCLGSCLFTCLAFLLMSGYLSNCLVFCFCLGVSLFNCLAVYFCLGSCLFICLAFLFMSGYLAV